MTDLPLPAFAASMPVQLVRRTIAWMERIPYSAIALAARIFPAAVFWMSGQTKVEGWHVTDSAIALFQDCLLYTSPSPRDRQKSRMPSSA